MDHRNGRAVGAAQGRRRGDQNFLSGTMDRFRVAYGRRTAEYPRQCIFVATTNECEFLRDRTGNRRFWIADIPKSARPKKDVFAWAAGRSIRCGRKPKRCTTLARKA
ncbi:VapE family protein (plasmid) [Pyramidobacter sp. YE332]|uniref:VapE domain-containing protein n=1 Tax=Pyramidobacter sp. YE332 TaxID=3068894 RepID=UPI00294B5B5E|nr:VapE domain-containing protein [Pyramidobacter sp. YE332]WOL41348.1 VapE family protein [Pyramidobacter sp. YE332]